MDTEETLESKINRSEYKILIVDDVVSNVLLLKILLTNEKFQVCTANNGTTAIEQAQKEHPDLILLDVMMPDLSGFDVAVVLKKDPETKDIPIIFLTALNTPQEWNLVVDGGTLIIDENVSASFGSLTLKDATFIYSNGQSSGWFPSWGTMVVAQKLAFDGSTPYDLTVPAHTGLRDIPYLTLGFTLSSEKGDEPVKPAWPHLTNLWTVVDFDVTDITKDSETDATIRLPIRNMVNMSYTDYNNTAINGYTYNPWQWCHFQGGIRKTGAGTLCLNGAISYTHTTEVAAGALLVDSSIATSSGVTVDSGAWLGGTGTVSAVTVKDGGGFICYAGRNTANVLRVPSLTAEGDVVVRVANPDGRDTTDFRQPVLQLTAKPASVDFRNWRVSYDGEEDHWRSFSFRYDSSTGVVSAFYSGGTMVIFR